MASTGVSRVLTTAGLAKDIVAIKRAKDESVRAHARKHLIARMGKLRGLPQKLGQILSMGEGSTAADGNDFRELCAAPAAIAFDEIEPLIQAAWGCPVEQVVSSIETEGIAASLGQVHHAERIDGQEIAIKVQYPGITKAVQQDLSLLGWLKHIPTKRKQAFDFDAYRHEILRDLNLELDYHQEAGNQERFALHFASSPGVVVPEVIPELSNGELLVTEWQGGEPLEVAARWPEAVRRTLSATMVRTFCESVFSNGFFHADLHAGNIAYRNEADTRSNDTGPEVVFYDFGSCHVLPERRRLLLCKLIESSRICAGDPLAMLIGLGFNRDLLEPIRDKLPALCSVIFEPFTSEGPFDLDRWKRTERVDDILGDARWNFRMSAPADLILLMRAWHGVLYHVQRLGVSVNWSHWMNQIQRSQSAEINNLHVEQCDHPIPFDSLARYLRIQVTENDRIKAELTVPAHSIESLEELMGADLVSRVTAEGVSLPKILTQVRMSGYAPQALFETSNQAARKHCRVWLE